GLVAPFLAGTTAAAGSLLRGRGRRLRVIIPYCEATVPTAMLLLVLIYLLARLNLGAELGLLPAFFLCIVPLCPPWPGPCADGTGPCGPRCRRRGSRGSGW